MTRSQFSAARDKAEVTIGGNTLRVEQRHGELPVYEIDVKEKELGCHLTYRAEVNGWKPGTGLSHFGNMGLLWLGHSLRAGVGRGDDHRWGQTIQVTGIGYHDHNWLNFPFQSIIQYWMWGRIYSEHFTAAYAFIQCNQKVDNHTVKVLMLANGKDVILSTGEFDFLTDDFEYNPKAKYQFPKHVTIDAPGALKATLRMQQNPGSAGHARELQPGSALSGEARPADQAGLFPAGVRFRAGSDAGWGDCCGDRHDPT